MNIIANYSENLPQFFQSLEIMGFGMAGIFIVLGMIYGAVKLLIKLFPEKAN